MADQYIDELTALTTAADSDLLIINDVDDGANGTTKKITVANLFAGRGGGGGGVQEINHVVGNWLSSQAWLTSSASEANTWRFVTYAKELGLFVAVAGSGTNRIMTSPDAITWTGRATPITGNWYGAAWSKSLGIIVAVNGGASGSINTSPDGVTWSDASLGHSTFARSIAWSEKLGMFAIAGIANNMIITSTNGTSWTQQTDAPTKSINMLRWLDGLDMFIAMYSSSGTDLMYYSTDGVNWDATDLVLGVGMRDATFATNLGIAVAVADNYIYTSENGINWTSRTVPSGVTGLRSVAYAEDVGLFVAVATSGTNRLIGSKNGIDWFLITPIEVNAWESVVYSKDLGLFVAVSQGGTNRVMTSKSVKTYPYRS